MLYPLIFEPIFKPRIWGGRRLAELFGKPLPPEQPIGESWELSGLPGDESVVRNGPLAGQSLVELMSRFGHDLLGHAEPIDGQFPLLIKLLDARQPLSVQVHPAAAMVRRLGDPVRLKNECWFVVDADPGASIYLGLRDRTTREAFAEAVQAGTVAELLQRVEARTGDFWHLPAGTVHAIGGGLIIAEVQTPSDTTYRVFDWNRLDPATGQSRPLHRAEALEAIEFDRPWRPAPQCEVAGEFGRGVRLVSCEHFTVTRLSRPAGQRVFAPYHEMVVWQVLSGGGTMVSADQRVDFSAGDCVLLPAAMHDTVCKFGADTSWLEITIPNR